MCFSSSSPSAPTNPAPYSVKNAYKGVEMKVKSDDGTAPDDGMRDVTKPPVAAKTTLTVPRRM